MWFWISPTPVTSIKFFQLHIREELFGNWYILMVYVAKFSVIISVIQVPRQDKNMTDLLLVPFTNSVGPVQTRSPASYGKWPNSGIASPMISSGTRNFTGSCPWWGARLVRRKALVIGSCNVKNMRWREYTCNESRNPHFHRVVKASELPVVKEHEHPRSSS